MNSLKTIYSRLTTMPGAIKALEDVGVAVKTIGENGEESVRPVNDILEDLSDTWWDLTDAQRQNLAVQAAGRYQLSRFLAMMNNYDTALMATESAVNSQGSAMRENAEYLKSFEARINSLKNGFTEFSMSVGDAILSGSFMALIEGLRGLAEFGGKAVDVLGGLPIVLGAIFLVMNKMKMFEVLKAGMSTFFSLMRVGMKDGASGAKAFGDAVRISAVDGTGSLSKLRGAWLAVATAEGRATAGAVMFKNAIRGIALSSVIGAGFVALGFIIEKLVGKWQEAKQVQEEMETMNKNMVESYRQHSDGMEGLINTYETLSSNTNRTSDEQKELDSVIKELAEGIPTTTEYIDSNGVAHMKTNEQIRDAVKAVSDLSRAEAELERANFSKGLRERQKAYADVSSEIEKQEKALNKLRETDGNVIKTNVFGTIVEDTVDNTTKMAERQVKVMMAQAEMTELIQSTTRSIQDQAIAYFEASGRMGELGDTQIGVMEKVASLNEFVLRDADNSYEAQMRVHDASIAVGEVFAQSFEHLTQGMERGSEGIEQVRNSLSDMAEVIPESFLSLKNENGEVVKSFEDVENGMKEIINVGHHIKEGSSDYDGLKQRLEDIGFTASEASAFVGKLGTTYSNASIRAEAMAQATSEFGDSADGARMSAEDLNEALSNVIDTSEILFGYDDATLSGLENHLESMIIAEKVYGDVAKSSDAYVDSLLTVSEALGISADEVDNNKVKTLELVETLMKVDFSNFEASDANKSINELLDGMEELSSKERGILKEYFANIDEAGKGVDILTGKQADLINAFDDVDEKSGSASKEIEDLWKTADKTLSGDSFLNTFNNKDFFSSNLNTFRDNLVGVDESLKETETQFSITRDALGKPILLDTSGARESFDNIKTPANETKKTIEDLRMEVNTGFSPSFGTTVEELKGVGGTASKSKDDVNELKTSISQPLNTMGFLGMINNQTSTADDKIKGLKDSIAGLESSNIGSLTSSLESISNVEFSNIDDLNSKISELSGVSNLGGMSDSISGVSSSITELRTKVASLIMLMGTMNKSIPVMPMQLMALSVNLVSSSLMKASGSVMMSTNAYSVLASILSATSSSAVLFATSMARSSAYSIQSAQASMVNVSAKNQEVSAYMRAVTVLSLVTSSYTTMSSSAVSANALIVSALNRQILSIMRLGTSYTVASRAVTTAFSRMSSTVVSSSSAMIGAHNTQRNAINTLAQTARTARLSIESLNSSVRNAMVGINNYIRSARTMASASSSVASAPSIASSLDLGYSSGISDSIATVASGISTFTASSEGGQSFGGGGEGSSGTMQTTLTSVRDSVGGVKAYALAGEKRAELYRFNTYERQADRTKNLIDILSAKMENLDKSSKKYRDSLREVVALENKHLHIIKVDLAQTEKRNRVVEAQISKLRNTSNHTIKQREDYNRLQQEYEENIRKIHSFKVEVEKATIDIKDKVSEIMSDMIEEIVSSMDKSVEAINRRMANIDFEMEVLELTDPDNIEGQMDLIGNKIIEYVKERKQYFTARSQLEAQLSRAVKAHGADSKEVANIVDELNEVEQKLQETTINILKTEKELRDIRGSLADAMLDKVKDHYSEMSKASSDSYDKLIKDAKDSHDKIMKMYDDEIKKINDVYDARIKNLDDEATEEDYQEELAERSEALDELIALREKIGKDDSLEGQKRQAELDKEIMESQKDLDKFIRDRNKQLLKDSLEEERKQQIESLEEKKEHETEMYESKVDSLEKEKEAMDKHYKEVIENESKWAEIRGQLIEGNFDQIGDALAEMGVDLEQLSDGTFDTLSEGFANYSDEVRDFVEEINRMIQNINHGGYLPDQGGEIIGGDKNDVIEVAPTVSLSEIIRKAKNDIEMDVPTPDKNYIYDLVRSSNIPEYQMQEILNKARSGEAMIKPTAEKMMFYELFQELFGKKVPSFDTGGFTGDWAGNKGMVATVHKREWILNEEQTKPILDVLNISEKLRDIMPKIKDFTALESVKSGLKKANEQKGDHVETYYLTVEVENMSGTEEDANNVFEGIVKGLKKLGK